MFSSGKFSEATVKYNECIKNLSTTVPGNFNIHSLLLSNIAACHLKLKNHSYCIGFCDESLSINPHNIKSILTRATANGKMGNQLKSYGDYQLACLLDPSNDRAQGGLRRVSALLLSQRGEQWKQLVVVPSIPQGPVFVEYVSSPAPVSYSDDDGIVDERQATRPARPASTAKPSESSNSKDTANNIQNISNNSIRHLRSDQPRNTQSPGPSSRRQRSSNFQKISSLDVLVNQGLANLSNDKSNQSPVHSVNKLSQQPVQKPTSVSSSSGQSDISGGSVPKQTKSNDAARPSTSGQGNQKQWKLAGKDQKNPKKRINKAAAVHKDHNGPKKGCIVARVKATMDKQSFLTPLNPLPPGYTQKDIFMLNNKIPTSILPIKKGDLIECVLGTRDKEKPFAMQAKVSAYRLRRSEEEIDDYFRLYRNMLCDKVTSHAAFVETLPATSQWYFLANMASDDAEYPHNLLDLVIEVLKAATEPSFKEFLKTLVNIMLEGKVFAELEKEGQKNDQVVAQLIVFCETVLSMLPKLLSPMLPLIKTIKSTPLCTKDFLDNILMLTQGGQHDIKRWQHLNQMLCGKELLGNTLEKSSTLKSVLLDVPYPNCEEYMDIYYRLMRTECLAAIQKGILDLKKGQLNPRNMSCFKDVYIAGYDVTGFKVQLALQFKPNKPVPDWKKTSQLMYGNLVCLSPNTQFNDPIWATVANRDADLLNKSGIICVEIFDFDDKSLGETINILQANGGRTLMVESPNYYQSFNSILRTLKTLDITSLPLSDQIVFSVEGDGPEYQKKKPLPEDKYVEVTQFLEKHQVIAFDHCLGSSVGIIQGPPGTGKTFLGAKLVELFLAYKLDSPILILTYKNHALDEFLGKILKFCDPEFVARIGGQSKDPEIENILLKNQIDRADRISTHEIDDQLKDLSVQLSDIFKKHEQMRYFSFQNFVGQLSDENLEQFISEAGWNKRKITCTGGDTIKQGWIKEQLTLIKAVSPLTSAILDPGLVGGIEGVDTALISIVKQLYISWLPNKNLLSKLLELEKQNLLAETADAETVEDITDHDHKVLDDDDEDRKDRVKELELQRTSAVGDKDRKNDLVIFEKINQPKDENTLFAASDFPSWCTVDYSLKRSKDIWTLTEIQKYKLILTALKDAQSDFEEEFENCFSEITKLQAEKSLKSNQSKVTTLRRMKIIGATITGASIHNATLRLAAPQILIVEEAAEILEPALLAAINPSLEQLIMIGDHKQLSPIVDTYYLKKEFKFDISMMERLISTGFPYKALASQGRMRPEFSDLLKDIYPQLRDFPGLAKKNVPFPCISTTMFFWDHEFAEQKERSVKNTKEATMAIALALFMICNGADPSQITIITSYLGQQKELRTQYKNAKQNEKTKGLFTNHGEKDVQIQTIDMYQGDENDYIIISLVRSPKDGHNIGFVNNESRRCVAQSRAKCGLYFIGNVKVIKNSRKSVWKPLIEKFEVMKCVGKKLGIKCDKHPKNHFVNQVNDPPQPTDLMYFVINPTTLCKVNCGADFPCKIPAHRCKYSCKPSHDHGFCKATVSFQYPLCSHPGEKPCFKDARLMECKMKVIKKFAPCRHKCEFFCFETLKPLTCPKQCLSVTNCGQNHPCDRICGAPHNHDTCNTMIFYKYPDCGHYAPKQKKCSQPINFKLKCRKKMQFKGKCGHPMSRNCTKTNDEIICQIPCTKFQNCGHPCGKKCGEPCGGVECETCVKALKAKVKAFKDRAEQRLKELEKKDIAFDRQDLVQGDAEYSSVEDRTLKYIQPSHNWSPTVSRIEKVSNTEHSKQFEEAKIEGFGTYTDLKFHGTGDVTMGLKE